MSEPRCNTSQEVWIDIDQDTKRYDCEIHISGRNIYEILDGISIVKDRIERDNNLKINGTGEPLVEREYAKEIEPW